MNWYMYSAKWKRKRPNSPKYSYRPPTRTRPILLPWKIQQSVYTTLISSKSSKCRGVLHPSRDLEMKAAMACTAASSASSWEELLACRCFLPILKEWSPPSMTCRSLGAFIFFRVASNFSSGQRPSLLPCTRHIIINAHTRLIRIT